MKEAAYVAAYGYWQKSIPFHGVGKYAEAAKALTDAASPEHEPRVEEVSYMSDSVRCACGWTSDSFFDGADIAMRQWRDHVMQEIQGEEIEVPCGC